MSSNNCQFHQEGNYIHVLIKAKGVQEEELDVQIQRRRLTVILRRQIKVEGLLHGQVDVGNSKVKIHPDCVEIKLRKVNEEESWPQLLLGIPDMMTSLQKAQSERNISPPETPTRTPKRKSKPTGGYNKFNSSLSTLNASLSNAMHSVLKAAEDETRDTSLSRASQAAQRGQ